MVSIEVRDTRMWGEQVKVKAGWLGWLDWVGGWTEEGGEESNERAIGH